MPWSASAEHINRKVAALLEKPLIEQTKSRSRQTDDNALAESKNASTARKYLGYGHIPQHFASQVNTFTVEVLSPYLNFHRPCHFPTEYTGAKRRIRKRCRYRGMMTPYEKPRSSPEVKSYFKPGTTLKILDATVAECSDNDAAQRPNGVRTKLFQSINKTQQRAA